MSKHTPRPWVVNEFHTAVWTSHDPEHAKSICECHFNTILEIERGYNGCHKLEAEANAKLIAAAPELLALLIELVDIEGPLPGNAEWAAKVRAAIHKATL